MVIRSGNETDFPGSLSNKPYETGTETHNIKTIIYFINKEANCRIPRIGAPQQLRSMDSLSLFLLCCKNQTFWLTRLRFVRRSGRKGVQKEVELRLHGSAWEITTASRRWMRRDQRAGATIRRPTWGSPRWLSSGAGGLNGSACSLLLRPDNTSLKMVGTTVRPTVRVHQLVHVHWYKN
jgi:hypothetical protein